jgi:hypothetical protein
MAEYEQNQIAMFCRKHLDKLGAVGYGTLMRLRGDRVVHLIIGSDQKLYADVFKFSSTYVWIAVRHYRVVTPRQL